MFYMVVRIYRDAQDNHSVQYFKESDYPDRDACLRAAEARYHNVITADLQNPDVKYQMTYIMDNAGNLIERPVIFDRHGE